LDSQIYPSLIFSVINSKLKGQELNQWGLSHDADSIDLTPPCTIFSYRKNKGARNCGHLSLFA